MKGSFVIKPITFLLLLLVAYLLLPTQFLPQSWQLYLTALTGPGAYQSPPTSLEPSNVESQDACPRDINDWRRARRIGGISIEASLLCSPDNPYAVAAFVRGTNNVIPSVLMKSGLTPDAVVKGRDLDGDGDPDEIHIRLEVAELNGYSPDSLEPVASYAIAPGIAPGLWVFAPKTFGMATENFESLKARPMLRAPSPAIRVEQGDHVILTLENSHYMPHTIHLHGVDHPFVDSNGEGNDGVPIASEKPVMPGHARSYNITPRQSGTNFYHCHVQPDVHIMMGLQGLFIVEENRPDNWLQTLNVGAGHVRYPSLAVREEYSQEYDLHYQNMDRELNDLVKEQNSVRQTIKRAHNDYNITQANMDYHLLNGKSFPYTFRESIVVAGANEKIKLRVVNGGSEDIALHTHGHKVTVTHKDGVKSIPEMRDVVDISPAQRVDLALETTNDGLHSYGPGIWLFHDHHETAITTDGLSPGGHISAIVYREYLNDNGWPKTQGVDWNPYFDAAYYKRKFPVWQSYDPLNLMGEIGYATGELIQLIAFGTVLGLLLVLIVSVFKRPHRGT